MVWTAVVGGVRLAKSTFLSPHTGLFLSWSMFVVLFFTLSKSKLPGYVLPAVPSLALMLARSYEKLAIERRKSFGFSLAVVAIVGVVVSGIAVSMFSYASLASQQVKLAFATLLAVIVVANGILAFGFLCFRSQWKLNVVASAAVVPVVFALVMANKLADGILSNSPKCLAEQLHAQHVPPNRTFVHHGVGRTLRLGLNFYMQQEVSDWDQNPDEDAYVVSGSLNCERLHKEGFDCVDVPLGSSASGWFVSHVTPRNLSSSLPRSGQPH